MTTVLHTRYGFTRDGLLRYATNRALRLFPPYWLILLSCLVLAGQARFSPYRPRVMQWPIVASEWIKNTFILGLSAGEPVRVIPPAWWLDIELTFYLLMGIGLARWRAGAVLWALASAAYAGFLVAT